MANSSSSETPVHLIVLCHGLWGEPIHLHTLATLLCRSFGTQASISKGTGGKRNKQQVGPGDVNNSGSSGSSSSSIGTSNSAEDAVLEQYIEAYITERKKNDDNPGMEVLILNSMSNKGTKTYDGIDWIAERVVREIKAEQDELQKRSAYVAKFSIIGYSLGGLVARYVIGLLDSQSFFNNSTSSSGKNRTVEARQFATFASPHIGVPPGNGAFGKLANFIGGRLLSRTGEQLYLLDSGWETESDAENYKKMSSSTSSSSRKVKVGLIESMSKPNSTFIRALNRFQKITFYANAVNDMTVPFRTGCIEEWDPFSEPQGNVEVKLIPDTPLISLVESREAPKLSTWQKVKSATPSVPFFLNPRRLPVRAPYNYLVILGYPILLPTFIALILYRFASESRKSRARVLELNRGWDMEEGKGEGGKNRIERLVKSVMMSVGEDRIDEERNIIPTAQDEEAALPSVHELNDKGDFPLPNRSPLEEPFSTTKAKQPDLLEAQKRMVRDLNDPKNIPRMEKRWTYFDDVVNSHAIIVCRSPSIEVHRRGLAVLKHFVDDFYA